MAVDSTAFTTILDDILEDIPEFGYGPFTITAIDAGDVKTNDPGLNQMGSNTATERFQNRWLFVPGASTASDAVRSISTISVTSGVCTISHNGPNTGTSAVSQDAYILAISADEVLNMANRWLRTMIARHAPILLVHGPDDNDMQSSGVTSWPATSGITTNTKTTTSAEVYQGARALDLTNNAANGYSRSTLVNCPSNGMEAIGYFMALDESGGGASFILTDQSGNVIDQVDFSEKMFLFGRKQITLATTYTGVYLRLAGTGSSEEHIWQYAGIVFPNIQEFRLPDWASRRYRVKQIVAGIPRTSAAVTDTFYAGSLTYRPLTEGSDYELLFRQADVHPYGVRVLNSYWMTFPLYVVGEATYADVYGGSATFVNYTDTTPAPRAELAAGVRTLIGKRYPKQFPNALGTATADLLDEALFNQREKISRVSGWSKGW